MCHKERLRLFAFHRNEAHRRPRYRFADRFGVCLVGLAAPDVGFHVRRRHQPDVMAELAEFPRPVVGPGTGLHTDQAGPKSLEEFQHLVPPQLPPQDDGTFCVDAVNLENGLREIDPDRGNLRHGWPLSMVTLTAPNVAHYDAGSGSHPLHQWRDMTQLSQMACSLVFMPPVVRQIRRYSPRS